MCAKVSSIFQQTKHLQEVFANDIPSEFVMDITVHEECMNQVMEEASEFERDVLDALVRGDIEKARKETIDFIADMQVYLNQYASRVGVLDDLSEAHYKIYTNNITKATSEDIAIQSCVHYQELGIDCYVVPNKFGDWVVKRKSDGKVMKHLMYESVEL